jgi:hypothetical protein
MPATIDNAEKACRICMTERNSSIRCFIMERENSPVRHNFKEQP